MPRASDICGRANYSAGCPGGVPPGEQKVPPGKGAAWGAAGGHPWTPPGPFRWYGESSPTHDFAGQSVHPPKNIRGRANLRECARRGDKYAAELFPR